MLSATLRRHALLLLVLSLFATAGGASPAAKDNGPVKGAEPAPTSFYGRAWHLLRALWANEGCHVDPNGGCGPAPAVTAPADTGCDVDPNGRCRF